MGGDVSSRLSLRALALVLSLACFAMTFGGAVPATESRAFASVSRTGSLVVKIDGLPRGERPAAVLRGPGKLRRSVPARGLTIKRAPAGKYTLTLAQVRIARTSGPIKAGATAKPSRRTVSVRVVARKHITLRGKYGSIINPGVKSLPAGAVVSVAGPEGNPTSIVLRGRVAFAKDAILSLRPSDKLPRGLLSHVEGVVSAGSNTRVTLRAASVYEVAPSFEFDIPVNVAPGAAASGLSCGAAVGLVPSLAARDISVTGGWNTVRVLGVDVAVGVRVQAHFTAAVGLRGLGATGDSCTLSAGFSFNGMAGPIPVTGGIEGELSASAELGGKFSATGSVRIDAGASTVGTPPILVWYPQVTFSNPRFSYTDERSVAAKAGIGAGVKIGLGNSYVASATLKVGTSVEFTRKLDSCSWDARFGQFSASGKVGSWTISTPKTPALFSKNLWRGCAHRGTTGGGTTGGAGGGGGGGGGGGAAVVYDHVTPLAPTSGPEGYAFFVSGPACRVAQGEVAWVRAELAPGTWSNGQGGLPRGTSLDRWTVYVPVAGPPGPKVAAVTCRGISTTGQERVVWSEPVNYTVTGLWRTTQLASTPSQAAGSVIFRSGATGGPDPCPDIPGIVPFQLNLWTGFNTEEGGNTGSPTIVSIPTPGPTATAKLPSYVRAGDSANASATCWYGRERGFPLLAWFNYFSTPYQVAP